MPNVIELISNNKLTDAKAEVGKIMAAKVTDAISNKRMEVAAKVFDQPEKKE